jgi:hypothetical protein
MRPPNLTASAGADDYNLGWPRGAGMANLASIRTPRLALPMLSSPPPPMSYPRDLVAYGEPLAHGRAAAPLDDTHMNMGTLRVFGTRDDVFTHLCRRMASARHSGGR